MANTLTNIAQLLIILIYASRVEKIKEAIFMPDKTAMKEWNAYFKLAIPSILMICGEWWYFELLVLTSGYIGVSA